ncbi:MAG: type 11 methyltransferase [Acidimicrobiaceae bacterium]|nr:MAG: type 11 methyltransferase [Acidimicrobiaceae bacterium]
MPHRIKTAARRLTERVLAPHFAEQTAELTRQMQLSFATGHLAEIPLVDSTSQLPVELTEFNHLLHALRTVELSRMPRAAKVLLSVGCSDRSYFDWIEQAHGRVEQHWGVELFRPEPDDLPSNARWIVASASAMPQVSDDSVDVIFSGQNFEHLPVADLVGFLVESHRVLMPGGTLVIDSPNRLITEPIAWRHPEHVIEVSPDEAKEILTLAGFDTVACRGIWLCRDDDSTILPLMPPGNDVDELLRRSVCAGDAPDRSFCWWLEAEASSRIVDRNELTQHISSVFDRLWTMRVNRGAFTPGVDLSRGPNSFVRWRRARISAGRKPRRRQPSRHRRVRRHPRRGPQRAHLRCQFHDVRGMGRRAGREDPRGSGEHHRGRRLHVGSLTE